MATATAHFDLTKAGSNENYNVGLVNSNFDKIDQQMYNNQQSAAKVMVGASSSADGESGRVPIPEIVDKDKFLKGDGTWDTPSGGVDMTGATASSAGTHGLVPAPSAGDNTKYLKGDGTWDTPSGGGGSSTLSGLTDVDLSSPTNGQILKYNSTTQKWENANESGGSQRTYLGQLIPRVSASDSKITASTSNSSYAAWGAFNGTSPSNLSSPEANSCWLPEANLIDQWIKYHFDAPRYFTKIGIVCFSNYSSNWVGDIKVEGSTDGSTWENILTSGTTYELTAELQNSTTVEINLDDTDLWEYIRVTFIDEISVAYQPSCFIDEIYVYGGSSGGENTRFESTELLSSTISTGGTYTLEDALENYDFITIVSGASNESDIRTVAVEDILNTLSDGITVNLVGAADRWVNITACSGTSITIAMNAPYIHSIKGYKLVGGGGSSSHTYSTTEQKVGTWIDGKPIFQKTIYYASAVSGSATIDSSLNTSNVGYFVCTELSYVCNNSYRGSGLPIEIAITSSGIVEDVNHASGASITETYATIRYTKVSTS